MAIEFGEMQGDGGNGSYAIVKMDGEEMGRAVKTQGLWQPPEELRYLGVALGDAGFKGYTRLAQLKDAVDAAHRMANVLARCGFLDE